MSDTMVSNFATVSDCLRIINDLEQSMLPRSRDRALVNAQFNGDRPLSEEEAKNLQAPINSNFLEGYRIAQNGGLQVNSALLYKERFFDARLLKGDITKRQEWSNKFTNNLHQPLKKGRSGKKFFYLMQNRNAALVLHGIGPVWWSTDFEWMPKFIALDDLLIPTDTPLEMSEELGYFGVNSWLTPWQLYQMTQSEKSQKGWNKTFAMSILKALVTSVSGHNFTPDYFEHPEKTESLWKQRSAYLNSDAVPKVKITTFFVQDTETGEWWRKVIVREQQSVNIAYVGTDEFLYDGPTAFADDCDKILHLQYGDGSVVAPFKYRSVRGLGVLLFSVIEVMNRLRCQFAAHVFSNMIPLLRVDNPVDRDRPRMLQYQAYGVIEPGVSFVPNDERHQIDPRLVTENLAEFRQLMSESSASYVQDIDDGTQKAQTLGEAKIKLQSVNKIISSMLMSAYTQEGFLYEEILRRFLKPASGDKQVQEFQAQCRKDGIPQELMAPECWAIEITKAFGSGDQTLAQDQVSALMQMNAQLDPTSQRKVRRSFISVMTQNPDLANNLVPEEKEDVTNGRKAAEDVFGTLMQGAQVGLREGIEQRDYVAAMLTLMEAVIARIEKTDQLGTPQDVIGLQTAAADLEQHIQILSQDPNEKVATTAAAKELGKMMNMVKAYAQRQQEAKTKSQIDPEAQAQIQIAQVSAAQDMHIAQQKAEQSMQQKQQAFEQKLNQDIQKHTLEMQRMMDEGKALIMQAQMDAEAKSTITASSIVGTHAKTASDIASSQTKTVSDIANAAAKTDADIANSKAKAEAEPAKPAEAK